VPNSVQQSRAKVAHGLFTFVASSRNLQRIDHGAVPRIKASDTPDAVFADRNGNNYPPHWFPVTVA
jgi:acyl-CoA hydrolase